MTSRGRKRQRKRRTTTKDNARGGSLEDDSKESPIENEDVSLRLNHRESSLDCASNNGYPQDRELKMPPVIPPRQIVPKDRFAQLFKTLKTQTYHDGTSRGPGAHTIRTVAWNPTGNLIATGAADRTLRIWNPDRPDTRYSTELRGHSSGIEKVAFNPARESELASCSSDGTVRFWDVRSKTCVSRLDVGGEAFTLAWDADGKVLMVGRKDDTLIPVSTESPSTPTTANTTMTAPYKVLDSYPQTVQTNATTFSHHVANPEAPNRDLFVTTGDGTVKIMEYPSFKTQNTLLAHTSACLAVEMAPTGRYLAIGGSDALISLWDTTDWVCKRTLSSANGGAVRGVSWSWDGRFIVGACDEQGCGGTGLEIFHAETGDSVYTIPTTASSSSSSYMNGGYGSGGGSSGNLGVPAVAWHPSRYWLAYSVSSEGGSGVNQLRIVGAAGGSM